RRALARDRFGAFIAQSMHVDSVQQMLARAEQDGPGSEMQFIDQGRTQILPDREYAAAETDVTSVRRCERLRQGRMNAFGDEAELGSSGHLERWTRMVGQHENGSVVRRLVAPPALPAFIRPATTDRAEHVASQNPGADPREAALGDAVVNS